jgi:hypothetical protein
MCFSSDFKATTYNDFNRKDLFTQHIKRTHQNDSLSISSPQSTEDGLMDAISISRHVERCYIALRTNPGRSKCLFCTETYVGEESWDNRLEHIAGHLGRHGKDNDIRPIASWQLDSELQTWLQQEGIIDHNGQDWMIGDGQPLGSSSKCQDSYVCDINRT